MDVSLHPNLIKSYILLRRVLTATSPLPQTAGKRGLFGAECEVQPGAEGAASLSCCPRSDSKTVETPSPHFRRRLKLTLDEQGSEKMQE